jgi:hypothetical protein
MLCVGLLVSWCFVEEPQTPPADSYCAIAKPIYLSRADTRETKEQADRENAKWKSLCAPKSQKKTAAK